MQRYNCQLNVGKQILTLVPLSNVSAAELVILKAEHGDDSVHDITKGRMDKVSHAREKRGLIDKYGEKKFEAAFGTTFIEKLPVTIEDVPGFDVEDEDEEEEEAEEVAA